MKGRMCMKELLIFRCLHTPRYSRKVERMILFTVFNNTVKNETFFQVIISFVLFKVFSYTSADSTGFVVFFFPLVCLYYRINFILKALITVKSVNGRMS